MGTKTGFPWGALSPKPAGPLSQVCGCSFPRRQRGAPAGPSLGNLSAPRGAALAPPPCPGPCGAALPSARLPPPGKSSARRRAPPGGRLPWPPAGNRQAAKASSSVHATAAAPRSIPPTAPGLGLAVPSPGGGRTSHTALAAAAAAMPPIASARLDPHLGGLLVAGNWPALGVPFFYPRQSPPSRQSIKPFRPDRPGTSMRESSWAGPLPPGPPPALRSAGSSADSNTRAHTHTGTNIVSTRKVAHTPHCQTDTASHAHRHAHTLLGHTHVHTLHSYTLPFTATHSHTTTLTHLYGG